MVYCPHEFEILGGGAHKTPVDVPFGMDTEMPNASAERQISLPNAIDALPREEKFDEAMTQRREKEIDAAMKGGIDLSSAKALSAKNNGQAIKFHIDPAQLAQLKNTTGFVPVIINIQPINNLKQFLGLD